MKALFILIFSLTTSLTWGYSNQAALKGAISMGATRQDTRGPTSDGSFAIGFNTHLGYRWTQLEVNVSSYVNVSKIERSEHQIGDLIINGQGTFRSVCFIGIAKYLFDAPFGETKSWYPYIGAGPSIGLLTYKLKRFTTEGGEYSPENKLTYDSAGALFAIGMEERLQKSKRPVFFEFSYKYMKTQEVTLVGGTNTKVKNLGKEDVREVFEEHTFVLSMGMTLF